MVRTILRSGITIQVTLYPAQVNIRMCGNEVRTTITAASASVLNEKSWLHSSQVMQKIPAIKKWKLRDKFVISDLQGFICERQNEIRININASVMLLLIKYFVSSQLTMK